MMVVAFIIGELAALVGVDKGAAFIIFIIGMLVAVAICYGLIFVGKTVKLWNKLVIVVCGVTLLVGYSLCYMQLQTYEYYDELQYGEPEDDVTVAVQGTVTAIQNKKYNYVVVLSTAEGLVYLQMDDVSNIRYGSTVRATGTINPMKQADNYGNYDERSYLHSNGVILKLKVEAADVERLGALDDYSVIGEGLYQIKQRAIEILSNQCTEKEMGLLSAIVLGERVYLDEEIKELYSSQSLSHTLSISGLHLTVIGMGLYSLMRRKMRYISSATISALVMLLFTMMTGNSVSAVRAVIMFVMHMLADVLGRKFDMLSAISLSALVLLSENPFYITNASFILSYSAMLAVAVTAPVVMEFFRAKNGVWKTMLFNISLTFTTMPITSCLFYRVSTYSVIVNLLVVPLMGIMLTMAIIGMLVSAFAESVGAACLGTSVYILRFYEWLCKLAEGLPASSVVTGNIEMWQIAVYYGLLSGTLLMMWRYSVIENARDKDRNTDKGKVTNMGKVKAVDVEKHKNIVEIATCNKVNKETRLNNSKKLTYTIFGYVCRVVVAISVALMVYIVYHPKNSDFELHFLDVGQGDCAYIHSVTGNDYLIDCGSTDEQNVGKHKLESFLEYMDVDTLEGVFISHCDTDHISGIVELIERGNIGIDTIILPDIERVSPSENGITLVKLALKQGISVKYFAKGSSYTDGELEFVCISPDTSGEYEDINEASMVLMMRYENIQAMYAGDIGVATEKSILEEVEALVNATKAKTDKDITTIYKVAHHGSKYSNSEELMELLQPDIAVISCGEDNSYGHPHEEAVERIEEAGCIMKCTVEYGEIMLEYEGDLIIVKQYRRRDE